MVHSKENGHRLRLVKQMEQLSLVEISKLKCLVHSVQSPKKRFLCLKREKKRTSKTSQGNNKSWLRPPHGLASCGASSRGSCIQSAHWPGATQLPPWRHAKLETPHPARPPPPGRSLGASWYPYSPKYQKDRSIFLVPTGNSK